MQMDDKSWVKNLKAGDTVFKSVSGIICGPFNVKEVLNDHVVVPSKNLHREEHDFVYTRESGQAIYGTGEFLVQDSEDTRNKAEACGLDAKLEGHLLGVAHSHSFLCLKTKRLLDKVFEAVTVKPSGKTLTYKEVCEVLKKQMLADEELDENGLRPCPMCGGKALEFDGWFSNENSSIGCYNCEGGPCVEGCKTIEEAREKWNKRT